MTRKIKSTVVIPTIGRPTLLDAVNSALREGLSVIVRRYFQWRRI